MKEKINASREKAEELAKMFGIRKETIDAFRYNDEPPLIPVEPNINPASVPDSNKLVSFFERIERLEEERRDLAADVREIFTQAKENGFNTKVMRQVLRLRKMNPKDRSVLEFLRDEYKKMVGIED